MRSHQMDLPRRILVGQGVLEQLGEFLKGLGFSGKLLLVSGPNVKPRVNDQVMATLAKSQFESVWYLAHAPGTKDVEEASSIVRSEGADLIIGIGGGKSVDVAKLAAHRMNLPFISVPTSASHDGIISPFASIRGLGRPYSHPCRPPIGILADIDLISQAPSRLLSSGCGDLIAKLTAVRDWEFARDDVKEYYAKYAAKLALLGAEMVTREAEHIDLGDKEVVRDIVEALISSGVAAGIAGSSRPCSGSEHLFTHALDLMSTNSGLHGEKCGIGTILMSKLQGKDWKKVKESLIAVNAPTKASQIGISSEDVIQALVTAQSVRPERYTILNKQKLDRQKAEELAETTGVI
ncbi:MAG: NAD(P)-dependent glycerol-1-phosphate dehydrogenase [Nitrososphaerales archaeon]